MIFTYSHLTGHVDETCDVCVVGSGAGGSVVAKELAEAGLSVILLEEGGYHSTEDFRNINSLEGMLKLYRNAGTTAMLGKPGILYVEGRCVGGSTTVNGGTCWRTPEKILKRWQWERGLDDLTPKKMDFYFKRVEETLSIQSILPEAHNKDSELLKKGAERLGYRVRANQRNHEACVGTNLCVTGCPTGGKKTPLLTYIPSFIKAGGRLYTNCRYRSRNPNYLRHLSSGRFAQDLVQAPDQRIEGDRLSSL